MKNLNFPVFALKTTKNYVFVAGGGGNRDYGKENGIVAFKKSDLNEEDKEYEDIYKTNDIIVHLQVYTPIENEQNYALQKLVIKERPAIAEKLDSESEDTNKGISSEESLNEAVKGSEKLNDMKNDKPINSDKPAEDKENNASVIYLAAIGNNNFYFLQFNGKFKLICQINAKIQQVYLNEHLIVLKNSAIAGFYNVINQKNINFNFKPKKFNENLTEEYIYKLFKKDNSIITLNDNCTQDILEDWFKFFVIGDSIHKIVQEDDKNVFVFHNKKYEIPGRISNIINTDHSIIFYTNKESSSCLYFLNNIKKMYDLPKITAIAQFKNNTCVSTSQGDIIVYIDGVYSQKYNVASSPITGLDLDDSKIYFSILTGEIHTKKYSKPSGMKGTIIGVIVLIIAIILGLLLKNKISKKQ